MKNVPVCLYTTTGFATQTAKPLAVFFFFLFQKPWHRTLLLTNCDDMWQGHSYHMHSRKRR